MKAIRRGIAVLIMAGLAVAVGLFWGRRDPDPVLPDGSRIRLLAVLGSKAPFTTEKPWQAFLRRNLPRKFVGLLPPNRGLGCGFGSGIKFVFDRYDQTGKTSAGSFWSRVETVDSSGFVYSEQPGSCTSGRVDGAQLMGFGLRKFPRREAQFPVRLFDRDDQLVAEFTVKNPIYRAYPNWVAGEFPMTNVVGNTRIVLRGLGGRTNRYGRYWRPQLTIENVDGSASPLQRRYFEFLDPTGNQGSELSPREPVWQAVSRLFRPHDAEFPDELRGSFELASLPKPGDVLPVNEEIEVDGVSMRLHFIAGAGSITISNGTTYHARVLDRPVRSGHMSGSSGSSSYETWESESPFILLETEDLGRDVEIQARVYDQDGEQIEPTWRPGGYNSGGLRAPYHRRYQVPLTAVDSATVLRLECLVNRGVRAEFLVNSADLLAEFPSTP